MYQASKVIGHVFVLVGSIVPLFMIIIFDFGIVLTLWYFFWGGRGVFVIQNPFDGNVVISNLICLKT